MQNQHKTPSLLTRLSSLALVLALLTAPFGATTHAAFGSLTSEAITLGSTTIGGATGTAQFTFTVAGAVPIGGDIVITMPSDFTAADIADASSNVSTFTDDGGDISANIASAVLSSNVITITTQTAAIAASSVVVIAFDNTVIDTNPSTAGQYSIQITTKDASGAMVDTGNVLASIGNTVSVNAVVAEALVMTITSGTSLNFNVDPSVNSGVDQTQSTAFNVKTNAATYSIQSSLTDSNKLCRNGTCAAGAQITSATSGENTVAFNTTGAGVGDTALGSNVVTGATGKTNSATTTVYYDLDVDYTIQAGNYTGTITYTAVPTF